MATATKTITVGERTFQIPGRLPFGIIRQHPKAFIALAKIKEFSLEAVLGGDAVDAMAELVHAAVASLDASVTRQDFDALLNGLDFNDGFTALSDAVAQMMKTRRAPDGIVAGESASSPSETSPVSAG